MDMACVSGGAARRQMIIDYEVNLSHCFG
jgi:hypothetical protein